MKEIVLKRGYRFGVLLASVFLLVLLLAVPVLADPGEKDAPQEHYTGFLQEEENWYYYEDGQINYDKTDILKGTIEDTTAWWYVKNGQVQMVDTVAKNENGWWAIVDGKVDFTYKGFLQNENGWWYLENGRLDFKRNTVANGTIDGESGWWLVRNNQWTQQSTVAKNEYGWWYTDAKGKVDFTMKTVARNEHGWFYIKDGKVDFTYTGIAKNEHGWWRIVNGKVDFSCNSVEKNEYGWFYIKNGQVDFTYTGLARNANGWFYIKNGKLDWDHYGLVKNENGWFYVKHGQIDFTFNSVEKNEYGWFYIKNGKVDFTYTGVAKNGYGWWRIEAGKVNFGFTGVASNENGNWYLVNGKLDFSYNGEITYAGEKYTIRNGQAFRGTIDPRKPMIALTYDDGPYSPVTDRILNALEKVGGHATFFVVGNRVNTYKSSVSWAYNLGCEIANHTWDHTSLTSLTSANIKSQIDKCNNAVYAITGKTPALVRPVGGAVNSTVKTALDYPLILWSVDTLDWKSRNADSVYSNIMNSVKDGDIILMHDLYTSTAAASEKAIPELVAKGYQLVTVSELAYYKGYSLAGHTTYSSLK